MSSCSETTPRVYANLLAENSDTTPTTTLNDRIRPWGGPAGRTERPRDAKTNAEADLQFAKDWSC
jgi:hypothetical protein